MVPDACDIQYIMSHDEYHMDLTYLFEVKYTYVLNSAADNFDIIDLYWRGHVISSLTLIDPFRFMFDKLLKSFNQTRSRLLRNSILGFRAGVQLQTLNYS